MMKLIGLLACLLLAAGCYTAPVMPPGGLLYANIQAPIDTDAESSAMGSRMGSSSSWAVLGLVASGDASVNRAARKAEITTIDHVDYQYLNVLLIYQRFTTKVYGQ